MQSTGADAGRLSLALSTFLADLTFDALSPAAVHECRRGVLDWIGCALAGSNHPAIAALLTSFDSIGSTGPARVIGHRRRLGVCEAAICNGQMGHVLDFDDTLLMRLTVLHTSSPVLAALFGLAQTRRVSGRELFVAYASGFEAGIRVGQTAPEHLEIGWHLTGTLGSIAAAAASAKLLGLEGPKINTAIAIGATQAAGMQQNRGTMCKSFHAGKAASNGILAGLLAANGFDSSPEIVEGRLGFCRLYSDRSQPELLCENLGAPLLVTRNGYKPYACGVVLHPTIDAALAVRDRVLAKLDAIERIELKVHPHVASVTGTREPQTGLHGKFSVYHTVAVTLVDGAAGASQYTDARVRDPKLAALRAKVNVVVDETYRKDQCLLTVITRAQHFESKIDHASGTVENPVSDHVLQAKFLDNAAFVLGKAKTKRLMDRIWRLPETEDAGALLADCEPA
jgi:2-methylcitrate dehydratase PrpD